MACLGEPGRDRGKAQERGKRRCLRTGTGPCTPPRDLSSTCPQRHSGQGCGEQLLRGTCPQERVAHGRASGTSRARRSWGCGSRHRGVRASSVPVRLPRGTSSLGSWARSPARCWWTCSRTLARHSVLSGDDDELVRRPAGSAPQGVQWQTQLLLAIRVHVKGISDADPVPRLPDPAKDTKGTP